MADNKVDLSWIFRFRFLKWLLAGAVLSCFLVIIFTSRLFIQPLYQSETIIYVPLTLFTQQYQQNGIGFGSDAEIDGHIQILKSNILYDKLEEIFNLSGLWNINTGETGGKSRLYDKLNSRIGIQKTRYNSISITFRHQDPESAADIANHIVMLGDIVKEEMLFSNRHDAYIFAKEMYEQKLLEIKHSEQYLSLNNFGISTNKSEGKDHPLQTEKTELSIKNQTFNEAEVNELTALKARCELLRKSLDTPLPRSYVVSPAVAGYNPVWPPRKLMALSATGAFIILMIFFQIAIKDGKTDNESL